MERLTRKSSSTDMVWFVDYLNNDVDLEPYEMTTRDIRLALEKLAYYEDLEEEGRLIVLSVQDIHPCRNCGTGWSSISSEGSDGCENYCERLKEYNKKYGK